MRHNSNNIKTTATTTTATTTAEIYKKLERAKLNYRKNTVRRRGGSYEKHCGQQVTPAHCVRRWQKQQLQRQRQQQQQQIGKITEKSVQ